MMTEPVETILTPCRVPWGIGPSPTWLTLRHTRDVELECTVEFGATRIAQDGSLDDCRVEIVFEGCHYARLGPCDEDSELACCLGYVTDRPIQDLIFQRAALDYVQAETERWRETGICPDPLVYVARRSAWLESLPQWGRDELRHYVVYGRDGYVELIAERATWRDWLVIYGEPESAVETPLAGEGVLEPADTQIPLRVPEHER